MWQAALFRLEPAAMIASLGASHAWPGPFFILSPPPLAMLLWTFAWIAVVVALSARSFELRDL
jgi:hypothetical protein